AFIEMISGSDLVAFYRPNVTSLAELAPFDVIIALAGQRELLKSDLIAAAFDSQKSVMTVSTVSMPNQFSVLGAAAAPPTPQAAGSTVSASPGAELASLLPNSWSYAKAFYRARITRAHAGVEVPAHIGGS